MRIIGVDLHARQQTIAMLDSDTGELEEKTLEHEGNTVREFYSALRGPILVGIEATGSMQWFLELMEELGIECRSVPAKIRKAETRKQKHDRRDARCCCSMPIPTRPAIDGTKRDGRTPGRLAAVQRWESAGKLYGDDTCLPGTVREFEYIIMVARDRTDVWWATPSR